MQRKLDIDHLPGEPQQRVFVGGHYDFMPTLRFIASVARDTWIPDHNFEPIIPIDDPDIQVDDTIKADLRALVQCGFAIFDLSDLGGQLAEIQVATQNKEISSLLVYPVRRRANEPERGRRTILSFGIPHFGYMSFDELKAIVWRFLTKATTYGDFPPRTIHRPILDREIRKIRVLLSQGRNDDAEERIRQLLAESRFASSLELWLLRAFAAVLRSDNETYEASLKTAKDRLCEDDSDHAEVAYYEAIAERTYAAAAEREADFQKVKEYLMEANRLKPNDPRILQQLAYSCWKLGDNKSAIEFSRRALVADEMPDPLVAVKAMNDLGSYLGDLAVDDKEDPTDREKALNEALEVTKYLEGYDNCFGWHNGNWLATRGWLLYLHAESLAASTSKKEPSLELLREARRLQQKALSKEPGNSKYQENLEKTYRLEKSMSAPSRK